MTPIRLIAALALLLLAGCGTTPPSTYHLLDARGTTLPSGDSPSLGVGPIMIPEYLNRNGLVYRKDSNTLEIASYERWAEPLADGIERVLSLNLASLLDTQNVRTFPWNRSRAPQFSVRVRIVALDAKPAKAELVAEWLLLQPGDPDTELTRQLTTLSAPLGGDTAGGAAVASAYSDLLMQLSERISAEIREAANQAALQNDD